MDTVSRPKSTSDAHPGVGLDVGEALSREEVFEIFSNRRRRYALHYLKRRDDENVPLGELAEYVAAWENDKPVDGLTADERKRVLTALRQYHLPKMEDCAFVEFDQMRGTVRLEEPVAELDVYLDVVPGPDVPWGTYYLLLSGLATAAVTAAWAGVAPFGDVPALALTTGIVVAFFVSALVHAAVNYRQHRIGATETPPEVTDR